MGIGVPNTTPIDPTAAALPMSCRLPQESVNGSQAWPVPLIDGGISFILEQPGRIPVPTRLYIFVVQGEWMDGWTDGQMNGWTDERFSRVNSVNHSSYVKS